MKTRRNWYSENALRSPRTYIQYSNMIEYTDVDADYVIREHEFFDVSFINTGQLPPGKSCSCTMPTRSQSALYKRSRRCCRSPEHLSNLIASFFRIQSEADWHCSCSEHELQAPAAEEDGPPISSGGSPRSEAIWQHRQNARFDGQRHSC